MRFPRLPLSGLVALCCAGVLGLGACGEGEQVAGNIGASETTNGFQSRVTDSLGRPVGHLLVTLYPSGQWSDSARPPEGIRTDSLGLVLMDRLDSGEYRVEVTDDNLGASYPLVVVSDGKLQFQEIRVRPLAHVRGRVALPAGAVHAWVQVLGSSGGVWTDDQGNFDLPVAVGMAPVVVRAVSILDSLPLGQDTLLLQPGEIRELGQLRDPFGIGSLEFGPPVGTYENPIMFSISSPVPGVRIHYTIDGSKPGPGTAVFNAPLSIEKTTLVRAWGEKPGMRPSPQESAWVRIRVRPVEFHPLGGTPLKVWIASTTYGAHAFCTTDGTIPTRRSPSCDTVVVRSTGWVKAIGVMDGLEDSRVDSAWFQGP